MSKVWIVYDERSIHGDTDIAQVLETCRSEREARRSGWAGVIFRYDVDDGTNEMSNPFQVGPTRELAREIRR